MTNVTNIDDENGDGDDSQHHPSSSSLSTTTTDVASLGMDTRDVSSSERVVKETSVDGIVRSEMPSVACLPTSHCLKGDDDEDEDDDAEDDDEEEDDGTIFVRYLDSDEDF